MDNEQKHQERRRNLRLVDRYDNDDYSRFAGPDYSDQHFEIGEEDELEERHETKRVWDSGIRGGDVNRENFYGKGPKGYRRSDEKIYEDACEILMRHRDIDASEMAVKVNDGNITLSGRVDHRKTKKMAELVLEGISGVHDIVNELVVSVSKGDENRGPEGVTKNDLGIT